MNYDVIVLGSGPGGYVSAIRASQLGLKVAVIEKESLGGICLNWGCIPTKALLKSAQVFEYINHAEDYGITVKEANADFPAIIKRSRDVADGMSNGIAYLLKKNKVEVIYGFGKVKPGNKVAVTVDGKSTDYSAKNIIIATGASSIWLNAENESSLRSNGISTCATCDGAFYRDKDIIVIGGGNSALEEGIFLAGFCKSVKIVNRSNTFIASKTYIEKLKTIDNISTYMNKTSPLMRGFLWKLSNIKKTSIHRNIKKILINQKPKPLNSVNLFSL